MPRVCVIGSANVDYTIATSRLPRPGETVSGGTLLVDMGGKGANQAVAARKLGAEVRMIGCVGDDAAGRDVRERLAAQGIDVDGLVTTREAATGTALITVDAEGRNQIATAPGANHRLTVEMAEPRAEAIRWAEVVVCQLETPVPVVAWALAEARRHQVTTVLNPAPVQRLGDDLLQLVDYLIPNSGEADALTDIEVGDPDTAREAASRLRERGVGTVIVTLGEQGALVLGAETAIHFPAFPIQAVDTTAAGDAFTGAFSLGLAAGGTLEQAIPLASAAAALTCTRRGAQSSLPDRGAVEAFLRRLRDSAPR
jgi:ribokinase